MDQARAEVSALLDARGASACRGRANLPWFVARRAIKRAAGNFGDELNVELGAALLRKPRPCSRDDARRAVAFSQTSDASARGKVLAIGSVLQQAEPGDVIHGAGLKPLRNGSGYSGQPAFDAIGSGAVHFSAVRGPRSCDVLEQRLGVAAGRCPRERLGDPGLAAPLLLPSWSSLRPAARRGDAGGRAPTMPRTLCLVRHGEDLGREQQPENRAKAIREAQLQALLRCVHNASSSSSMPSSSSASAALPSPSTRRAGAWPWRERWAQLPAGAQAACSRHVQLEDVSFRLVPRCGPGRPYARDTLLTIAERVAASCDAVASSALHGLILADSLRVPSLLLGNHSLTECVWHPHRHGAMCDYEADLLRRRVYRRVEPDFKYADYFAGIGKPGAWVASIVAAVELLERHPDDPRFRPRLSLGELRRFALDYVRGFPFRHVCQLK